jgi:lysophospholipase L1-like esterase
VCRYEAENSTLGRSATPRVVFMGDSITEFWRMAHPEFFVGGFIDRGISGQTSGQMLVRFRQDVIALRPAVVHIMAGTNDIAGNAGPTTLQAIKNNIMSMVELARANDVRVVLSSIPPADSFPWRPSLVEPAKYIVVLNAWLRQYAEDHGLIYADYHEPLADDRDAMKETFSNDGVHPNREGYTVMERVARRAIAQALSTVQRTDDRRSRSATPGSPNISWIPGAFPLFEDEDHLTLVRSHF